MSKKSVGNLQFAVFFFIFFAGVIFISLIFRAFFLVSETKFDGSSHFTLQLNEKGRAVQYISFSPQSSTIGILTFKNTDIPLEIPVDAKTSWLNELNSENLKPSLFKEIFDFRNQKEVNFIDIFRLFLFTQTVKDNSISQILISKDSNKTKVDTILSTLFIDPKITEEKLNIEVVNATEVYGLGNRVANLVSNTGANVVLVSTGEFKKESVIEYSEPSYTVEKISKLLKIKKNKVSRRSLADVTIVVGEDHARLEH